MSPIQNQIFFCSFKKNEHGNSLICEIRNLLLRALNRRHLREPTSRKNFHLRDKVLCRINTINTACLDSHHPWVSSRGSVQQTATLAARMIGHKVSAVDFLSPGAEFPRLDFEGLC
jgi:hypothetical protein